MGDPQRIRLLSEAEYLELERAAAFKSEYFGGEVFAMAGASIQHNRILRNLMLSLSNVLRGRRCEPFGSDLRVKAETTGLLTYPDITVVCGPPLFLDDRQDTVLNPTLLLEVLSAPTEAYDRGAKFQNYRLIPSLRDCVLIGQYEPKVEVYSRHGEVGWVLTEASGLDSAIVLPALEVSLDLREVYAQVEFQPRPKDRAHSSP